MKYFQPIEWGTSEEYIKNNINILNQTLNEKNKNLENHDPDPDSQPAYQLRYPASL